MKQWAHLFTLLMLVHITSLSLFSMKRHRRRIPKGFRRQCEQLFQLERKDSGTLLQNYESSEIEDLIKQVRTLNLEFDSRMNSHPDLYELFQDPQNFEEIKQNISDTNIDQPLSRSRKRALHYAAMSGHKPYVDYCLQQGAYVDQSDRTGNPPVFYAAGYDYEPCVYALYEANANTGCANRRQQTILHIVANNGNLPLTKFFVEKNPNLLFISDEDGNYPLHLACCFGLNRIKKKHSQKRRKAECALFLLAAMLQPEEAQKEELVILPNETGQTFLHMILQRKIQLLRIVQKRLLEVKKLQNKDVTFIKQKFQEIHYINQFFDRIIQINPQALHIKDGDFTNTTPNKLALDCNRIYDQYIHARLRQLKLLKHVTPKNSPRVRKKHRQKKRKSLFPNIHKKH